MPSTLPLSRVWKTASPLLALALAACSGGNGALSSIGAVLGDKGEPPCPQPIVVADAKNVVDLAPDGTTPEHVRLGARINVPVAECAYKDNMILVDLSVPVDVARGPMAKEGHFQVEIPYFVAVTDRYERILAKQVFTARINVGGDQKRTSKVEAISQLIRLGDGQSGADFLIYVGFQLTAEQLEFNRRQRL